MRYCATCNRPVTEEYHDRLKGVPPSVLPGIIPPRRWACRMVLVAETPTGKMFETDQPQRITETNTRYVHRERLENQ